MGDPFGGNLERVKSLVAGFDGSSISDLTDKTGHDSGTAYVTSMLSELREHLGPRHPLYIVMTSHFGDSNGFRGTASFTEGKFAIPEHIMSQLQQRSVNGLLPIRAVGQILAEHLKVSELPKSWSENNAFSKTNIFNDFDYNRQSLLVDSYFIALSHATDANPKLFEKLSSHLPILEYFATVVDSPLRAILACRLLAQTIPHSSKATKVVTRLLELLAKHEKGWFSLYPGACNLNDKLPPVGSMAVLSEWHNCLQAATPYVEEVVIKSIKSQPFNEPLTETALGALCLIAGTDHLQPCVFSSVKARGDGPYIIISLLDDHLLVLTANNVIERVDWGDVQIAESSEERLAWASCSETLDTLLQFCGHRANVLHYNEDCDGINKQQNLHKEETDMSQKSAQLQEKWQQQLFEKYMAATGLSYIVSQMRVDMKWRPDQFEQFMRSVDQMSEDTYGSFRNVPVPRLSWIANVMKRCSVVAPQKGHSVGSMPGKLAVLDDEKACFVVENNNTSSTLR